MAKEISFASVNLYNLNEAGAPLYRNSCVWSEDEYARKLDFLAQALGRMKADVIAFQELWHKTSLYNLKEAAGFEGYEALVPDDHMGEKIMCAGFVRSDYLAGEPRWIEAFPPSFRLQTTGDDAQSPPIALDIDKFSRPVLNFHIKTPYDGREISVYVCHLKSKAPERVYQQDWFHRDQESYRPHSKALGAALATIRRTAEAAALRMILTNEMKGTATPVVVLGDLNDGVLSNTLNILTEQPNYLMGFSRGGGDNALYTAHTLQSYRSTRDVYYTHIYQNQHESLDQILVSQEFYDNSRTRIWAFEGLEVMNDHLTDEDHRATGSTDHGIIRARFRYQPAAID